MPSPLTKQTIAIGPNQPRLPEATAHGPWADWQRHLDAGRIGTRSEQTPEQRARHVRNERVLLGERRVGVW